MILFTENKFPDVKKYRHQKAFFFGENETFVKIQKSQ